jgi:peroxiredoxin
VLTSFARDPGPNTVMLSIARDSTRRGARSFARKHGLRWTILFDSGDRLTDAFRIVGQPATFVIDGRGRVVWRKLGPVTRAMLTAAVRRA